MKLSNDWLIPMLENYGKIVLWEAEANLLDEYDTLMLGGKLMHEDFSKLKEVSWYCSCSN